MEFDLVQLNYALNTFYLLMSGALVMWMAAGFSMLEAGLVRAKNTTEILTKNVAAYSIATLMYLLIGFQLMYGGSPGGWLPSLGFLIAQEPAAELFHGESARSHAQLANFFYQVVFVATSMSIISGAVAERMKLWSFLLFAVVMTGFIYPVQGYWLWGDGFLKQMGFKDFAGSGIVHMAGATAALAGVLLLGPRKGKYGREGQVNPILGANLPLSTLGTFMLWLGWFGFNGGSLFEITTIEKANSLAQVFVNTNLAGASGVISALLMSRVLFGKADLTMVLNGALAGLVAITASPATPTPVVAAVIGAVGGVLVVFAILSLDKYKIDDPVGAISAHGVSGFWGLLAVPLSNEAASFMRQLLGAATIFIWVFATSFLVWWLLKITMGIRVNEEDEYEGVDLSECGLEAYPEFVTPK